MAHPFFDAVRYPWALTEAQAFHVTLYRLETDPGRIEILYNSCALNLPPLALGQTPDVIWRSVLQNLTTARALAKLCEILLADADHPAAHGPARAVQSAVEVTKKVVFSKDIVFIDRKQLRAEFGKLTGPNPPYSVLLVRGLPNSGKSWTHKLIGEHAFSMGESCVYLMESLVSNVPEVMNRLFAALGDTNAKPPNFTTSIAWYREACSKMQELAQRQNKVFWIVADDLGVYPEGPRLDPEIRKFFDEFAVHMIDQSFRLCFRLILLDYPAGAVPTRWKNFWVEEVPDETAVHEEPLSEYLLGWAQIADKHLDPTVAKSMAQDIMAKIAQPPPENDKRVRLQRIHDEVQRVLGGL